MGRRGRVVHWALSIPSALALVFEKFLIIVPADLYCVLWWGRPNIGRIEAARESILVEYREDSRSHGVDPLHLGFVSPPIGEALARDTLKSGISTVGIREPKFGAGVPAEIKLRRIALQMLFADMVEGAIQAAL